MREGILLVELPPWDPRTPPLGIAYLASYLQSRGIEVDVFDLNIEMYNSTFSGNRKGWGNEDYHWWYNNNSGQKYSELLDAYAERILSFNRRIIGLSATLPSLAFMNLLLPRIRNRSKDALIIVGGPATFFKKSRLDYLDRKSTDYLITGDGEETLCRLLKKIQGGKSLSFLSRLAWRVWKDDLFDRTVCIRGRTIMDLDSLPLPTFEEFDLSRYTEGTLSTDFTLPLIFSKGCTRRCTFCSDRVLSNPYRCRKPEGVFNEMKTQVKKYHNRCFRLNDLSFNANPIFLDKLCDLIIGEGLIAKWYGQAQVRPDTDKKLFAKLKKAGCAQFSLGLESFSNHVLSLMGKGYTAEAASAFLKASKEAGIDNHIAIIVGYPGETEDDFNETLKYLKANISYIDRVCSLNICGMPAGSTLSEDPQKYDYFFGREDWVTTDNTNTYRVRKRRYNQVIEFCQANNIAIDASLDLDDFEEYKRNLRNPTHA